MRLNEYWMEKIYPKDKSDFLYEIDFYESIDKNKIDIIKSAFNSFDIEQFNNPNNDIGNNRFSYVHTISVDKETEMVVPISFVKSTRYNDMGTRIETLCSNEEETDRLNKYKKVGSQNYLFVDLLNILPEECSKVIRIVYTSDGKAFMTRDNAELIEKCYDGFLDYSLKQCVSSKIKKDTKKYIYHE